MSFTIRPHNSTPNQACDITIPFGLKVKFVFETGNISRNPEISLSNQDHEFLFSIVFNEPDEQEKIIQWGKRIALLQSVMLPVETDWKDLFPDGRLLYYEGDDPDGFVKEMKEKYGFDPTENISFAPFPYPNEPKSWSKEAGYLFHCPPEHMNEIYGTGKYPLGS
jgi:hypothetical protein